MVIMVFLEESLSFRDIYLIFTDEMLDGKEREKKIGHQWIIVGVECWVPLCLLCYSVYFCAYLKFFIVRCFFTYVGKKAEISLFCSHPLYS